MEKQQLRERIWDELAESGAARFPFPPHGRIPNFDGAEQAAEQLADTPVWNDAMVIKSNPDSPQRPVRHRALAAGKTVYMAVPRLRDEKCFLRLDPAEITDIDRATTISGSAHLGTQVTPEEMEAVDLIVSGSVAVTPGGARIGKGEGYSDLEYAVLREFGIVDGDTPVVTTVHELQVVDDAVPVDDHDVQMDLVVTPQQIISTDPDGRLPDGIQWDVLPAEKVAEIPVLQRLQNSRG